MVVALKDPYGKVANNSELHAAVRSEQKSKPPASAFAEHSEPSDRAPEDNPKSQLVKPQEENPQVIAHKPGKQAAEKTKSKL